MPQNLSPSYWVLALSSIAQGVRGTLRTFPVLLETLISLHGRRLAPVRLASFAPRTIPRDEKRAAFATQARFPDVGLTQEWPDEALERLRPDRGSAVVALTHDPKLDDPALAAALRSDCFYIGALGSRRNHAGRRARLKELGFSDDDLARIHGPVGLAIGAVSPAEVAISIVAQMTQILRRGEAAGAA